MNNGSRVIVTTSNDTNARIVVKDVPDEVKTKENPKKEGMTTTLLTECETKISGTINIIYSTKNKVQEPQALNQIAAQAMGMSTHELAFRTVKQLKNRPERLL